MKKFLFALFVPFQLLAQNLPDSIVKRIDSIFSSFSTYSPGCAVAVTRDNQLVFQKGYGMANLEYSVPIRPETIFHIASESKQYVAFCMLLLEKEGKISIDDDIRKYLNYVPDFGYKITIRHLIHHTSGLRDQWQLLANAGWQLDDVIKKEHVIKLVSQQKALNFIPGNEFMYCNTGYTLMADIVEKVSGLTLRHYADKYIFQPLGMKDTHFHDDYEEIVTNRAYSYSPAMHSSYKHAVLSYSIVGATSLFTTVQDEVKWLNNFETGAVGGKDLIKKMYQTGVLNDGRKLNYAFALGLDKYKGWQQIGHGGADAGFRTYACRFPEKSIGLVVFSNLGSVHPWEFAIQIADILIPDKKAEDSIQYPIADSNFHKKLQGTYYTERGDLANFTWENGKLFRSHPYYPGKYEIRFSVAGNNRYPVINGGPVLILDEKNSLADSVYEMKMDNTTHTGYFKRLPSKPQSITGEFAGRFFNGEVEAFYTITEKDGVLTLEHRKFDNVPLKNIAPDQFSSPHWWISHIRFIRDKKNRITAFEVNAGRVQHLRYEKVKGY